MKNVTTLSVAEIHNSLSDVLAKIFYLHRPVVVERHGKPMAVMIHPDDFARLQASQEGAAPDEDQQPHHRQGQ